MKPTRRRTWTLTILAFLSLPFLTGVGTARSGEVTGQVVMPEVCSPSVSPAVVTLEPVAGAARESIPEPPREVAVVNQRGLQFAPRVQAIGLGQSVRFTNEDAETHNVHVVSPGNEFNESMAPGQPRDFTPSVAGVVRLACDIHSHMRGYIVVSASPFVRVCSAKGRFRIEGVPDGEYHLTVWHEMGEPLRRDVTIKGDQNLGTLTLAAPPAPTYAAGESAPARPWPDVIDRISVLLASGLDAAGKPDGFKKARKYAEDSYWGEFEASDMETAARLHLGFAPASELERKFRAVVPAFKSLSLKEEGAISKALDATRTLLLALAQAADALNKKGVTDGSRLQAASAVAPSPSLAAASGDADAQLAALRAGFDAVQALADRGEADEAAATMTSVYFDEFEPLERFIAVHHPGDIRPLELAFNAIRGEVGQDIRGQELAARLDRLHADSTAALGRSQAVPNGTFAPAFAASLVTIVREGVEVILLLTMLLALVAKAGQPWGRRAIAWGVSLAVLASGATALGLNLLVTSAQGRTREILEGGVMLAAAGVLFYVSYWLISQAESQRWMAFLKRQAQRGNARGHRGFLALAATAFLAVYREGAETALMYQALIGSQDGASAGLLGLGVGLGLGLVALLAIAYAIRKTSVRLPLRAFFQLTGGLLFAMAVVFAGDGVFELQASGVLKSTPLTWLGNGVPFLGLHPNVQALSVQGLLLAGAALALVLMLGSPDRGAPRRVSHKSAAGAGA